MANLGISYLRTQISLYSRRHDSVSCVVIGAPIMAASLTMAYDFFYDDPIGQDSTES